MMIAVISFVALAPLLLLALRRWPTSLVILALFLSSNVGLAHNLLAIRRESGQNLIGLRDVLILLLFVSSVLWRRKRLVALAHEPILACTLAVVLLTPIAALVGLWRGAHPLILAQEVFTMLTWGFAVVVAANLDDERSARSICNAIIMLSVLLSVGVFVESLTLMQIRIVTPGIAGEGVVRPQPSGWPVMAVGLSLLTVEYVLARTHTRFRRGLVAACIAMVGSALFLTQSRTFAVGYAASTLLLAAMMLATGTRSIRVLRLGVLFGVIAGSIYVGIRMGSHMLDDGFREYMGDRYAVLRRISAAVEYSQEDTRRFEVEQAVQAWARSPLTGVGLATRYRESLYQEGLDRHDDAGVLVHNIHAFFLLRLGPAGLGVFLLFNVLVLLELSRQLRSRMSGSVMGCGLAVGLVNLLVCAAFGNVFGQIANLTTAMISLGALAVLSHARVPRGGATP